MKTKQLENKVGELNEELRKADESNYKRTKLISQLMDDNKQLELDCSALKSKVERLEEELGILRGERKEIQEKTKGGIDKDAVIVQLILEKDRLAIENLKNHTNLIEQNKIVLETVRLANQRSTLNYPMPAPAIPFFSLYIGGGCERRSLKILCGRLNAVLIRKIVTSAITAHTSLVVL